MFENTFLILFGVVIAIAVFWLFAMWVRSPRESRWPRWPR